MTMNKVPLIKAATGFRNLSADAVLSTSNAINAAMAGNANFPANTLPFDLAVLQAANQSLANANAAALDGGSKALSERNHQKEVVVKLLEQLAKYVDANCKSDMAIFLSSGFKAVSTTRTVPPPVSEAINKIVTGPNSGQMRITPKKYPGAGCLEMRWAPVPAGGVPTAWMSQPVTDLRNATVVSGLTPGTVYAFQVRAIVQSGYTDWSDSVTKMAV